MKAQHPQGPPTAHEIGRAIRAAREQAWLLQWELAGEIGIPPSAVSQWERGVYAPSLTLFRRLLGVLGPWPLLQALLPGGRAAAGKLAGVIDRAAADMPYDVGSAVRIGSTVRAAREQAGLNQRELAARTGVSPSAVSQWECNTTSPLLSQLRALVRVLGPWPLLGAVLAANPTQDAAKPTPRSRPSPEDLAGLVAEDRSDQEIGQHYGVSKHTVRQWRLNDGLLRGTVGSPGARPDREEFERLAIQEGRSDTELAERYGRSPQTIKQWRRRYNLLRPRGHRPQPAPRPRPSPEDLAGLVAEDRSDPEIGQHYGVPRHVVAAWRREDGLSRRRVDHEQILGLAQQGAPAKTIAKTVGCHQTTVYRVINKQGAFSPDGQVPAAREAIGQAAQLGQPPRQSGGTVQVRPPPPK